MLTRHVFLSFVEEDLNLVQLFRGQARNKNSALAFDDYSVKVPYNSVNGDYIRRRIRERIRAASVVVCLVGAQTHRSPWVDWEIRTAREMGKGLIGVRLASDRRDVVPSALVDAGARGCGWDVAGIVRLIG